MMKCCPSLASWKQESGGAASSPPHYRGRPQKQATVGAMSANLWAQPMFNERSTLVFIPPEGAQTALPFMSTLLIVQGSLVASPGAPCVPPSGSHFQGCSSTPSLFFSRVSFKACGGRPLLASPAVPALIATQQQQQHWRSIDVSSFISGRLPGHANFPAACTVPAPSPAVPLPPHTSTLSPQARDDVILKAEAEQWCGLQSR